MKKTYILIDYLELLTSLTDLKHYIDIQKPNSLFHPQGIDVRKSDGYKQADELINKLLAYDIKRTEKPSIMLFNAVPVCNVVPENSAGIPPDTHDALRESKSVFFIL